MKKYTFIGAGSLQFTVSCMRDLLTFPAFRDCEICLMDINRENLDNVYRVCLRIREAMAAYETNCVGSVSKEIYDAMKTAMNRIESRIEGK